MDASELVDRAVERFRVRAPNRSVVVDLGADLPPFDADPSLIRRALENLLSNAIKYSGPQSTVTITARARADDVRFEVRDQGAGLTKAEIDQLFTPFFRAGSSRQSSTGVGLGLVLTRRIVESHGGDIEVESQPGIGTTVAFTVPRRRSG